MFPGSSEFTLENVSGKTIIWLDVAYGDNQHSAHKIFSVFPTGERFGVAPGAATTVGFFAATAAAKELHLDVIFYGDGSGFGRAPWKARAEGQMLGAALEMKRDAGLLAASPDRSLAGVDRVTAQINSQPVNTPAGAAQTLRGIALPGISAALIRREFTLQGFAMSTGARAARGVVQGGLSNLKQRDANAMKSSPAMRQMEQQWRSHALSDLAARETALSAWQVHFLQSMFQAR